MPERATFNAMNYGPLGEAVAASVPYSEADPVGTYAAVLAMWSAAVNGQVIQPSGRPSVVWTALVGKSKVGRKGYAEKTARAIVDPTIGVFLKKRIRKGVTSGASLINVMYEALLSTKESESGLDGRIMIIEDEWSSVLKLANRDSTYNNTLILAWDGSPIVNTTKGRNDKRKEQRVENPMLGFHVHIQPGVWGDLAKPKVALGGMFNRILHFYVERSKHLPSELGNPLDNIMANPDLTKGYKWIRKKPRRMVLSQRAAKLHDEYRIDFDYRCAAMDETVSCFIERGDEYVLRIACQLTAAECETVVTPEAWYAAQAMVERSVADTVDLITAIQEGRITTAYAKPASLIIRQTLERFGGQASRSVLLRAMAGRGSADSIDALIESSPDIVEDIIEPTSRGGAPMRMVRLVDVDDGALKTKTVETGRKRVRKTEI